MQVDIAKFAILHAQGGLYVDTDMRCLRPLDGLLVGARLVVAAIYIVPGARAFAINNAFIACTPAAPEVAAVLHHVSSNPAVGSHCLKVVRVNETAGPILWTRIMREAARPHADTAAFDAASGVRLLQPGVVDLLCPPELMRFSSWCVSPPAKQHIQAGIGQYVCHCGAQSHAVHATSWIAFFRSQPESPTLHAHATA